MSQQKISWVDSHAHVFDENCHYAEHVRYIPKVVIPPREYLTLLDRSGISAAVLVQPSFLGTDNTCLCQAIALRPLHLRGVAVVPMDVSAQELDDLKAQGVRGVRLNLIGLPDPEFRAPLWTRWLDTVAQAGLPVDLHAADDRWVRLLPPLLERGMSVVVEHLGRPSTSDPLLCPGFQAILVAGSNPGVWVKLSAPYRSPEGAADRAAVALLERLGPDRLLWGSDFPWTQHEQGKSMDWAMGWLTGLGLPETALAQLVGGNARRLYDLPDPGWSGGV